MANHPTTQEEILMTLEIYAEEILAAATQAVELPIKKELWLLHVVEPFGTVNGIFTTLVFDEGMFDQVMALVRETVGEMSWRGGLKG